MTPPTPLRRAWHASRYVERRNLGAQDAQSEGNRRERDNAHAPPPPPPPAAVALRQQWSYWGFPTNLKGWSNTTAPCGTPAWDGVECEGGRVAALALPGRDLGGSLSPSLAALTSLKTLNLSNNRVGAGLPDAWAGKLPALTTLALANCTLVGPFPASWAKAGAMPNLTVLDASLNTLSGPLPAGLGEGAPRLAALALARNNFSGPLPPAWGANGSLASLEVLTLDDNKVGGGLPDGWAGLKSLKALSLANTGVGGPLPAAWAKDGAFPALQVLNLAGNKLEGGLAPWASRSAFPRARGEGKWVVLAPGNAGLKDARIPDGTPFPVLKATGGGRYVACGSLPDCGPVKGGKGEGGAAKAGALDAAKQTLTATLELEGVDGANVTDAQKAAIVAAVAAAVAKTKAANVSVAGAAPLADAPALADVTAVPRAARRLLQDKAAGAAATQPGAQVRVSMDAAREDVASILSALRSAARDGSLLAALKDAGLPATGLSLGSSKAALDAATSGGGGGKKGLSGGAVAGIVIGVLLGLALLAALAWWFLTQRRATAADGGKGGAMLKTNAAYGGAGADRDDAAKPPPPKKEKKAAAPSKKEAAAAAPSGPAKKEGVVPYSEYRRQRLAGAAAGGAK